jgi:voltage-gated potassium channel
VPPLIVRLSRVLRSRLTGWRLPLVVAVFVFLSSWLAMSLAEPSGSDIVAARDYWWYFIVTAATVGYGDLFPTSTGGRLVGAYVIVGGIVTLTLLFTSLADYVSNLKDKRMRGAIDVDLHDHVVLLGYTAGRTERILKELTAEGRLHIVLCAFEDDVPSNPVPEQHAVHFVRGDLTRAELMSRAGVARARTAVVDGRDDNETLAIAVAVDHAAPDIHLVAALRDLTRREQLSYVNPHVQCVQWHMPFLLTEEATDPGITQVYTDLMTSGGHGNTYSMTLPAGSSLSTVGDCQTWLGQTFGATLLAVRREGELTVSAPWTTPVGPGTTLYYVASRRIDPARLTARR